MPAIGASTTGVGSSSGPMRSTPLLSQLLGPDLVARGGQAASGGEVELPVVQRAGEHVAVHGTELRQVRRQVRAAGLDLPAVELDVAAVVVLRVVPVLHVVHPLLGQTLEERVEVLVVLADAGGAEAHR